MISSVITAFPPICWFIFDKLEIYSTLVEVMVVEVVKVKLAEVVVVIEIIDLKNVL